MTLKVEPIHIITDVDGIFTSANLTFSEAGKSKHFSVNDSLTARFLQDCYGDLVTIEALTGDVNEGLALSKARLDYMNIPFTHCKNVYKYHWIKEHYDISKIIYIGDDIFDLAIFRECKFSATVANAPKMLKTSASYVSPYEGGKNAFTDIIFHILESQLHVAPNYDLIKYVKNKEKEYHDRKTTTE